MKRLLMIGFAACAFALTPTLPASAMPAATPAALGGSGAAVIQVKGGHGHGHGHIGRAVAVIITDGAEGEDIIMVGATIFLLRPPQRAAS
jgi:hypothetical protein